MVTANWIWVFAMFLDAMGEVMDVILLQNLMTALIGPQNVDATNVELIWKVL